MKKVLIGEYDDNYSLKILTSTGYAAKTESQNWFYAVGGYHVWGKGKATVSGNGTCFTLDFEFKFYDRYNWDITKSTKILGIEITDKFMGNFHRQALAKEFDMIGSVSKSFSWKRGENLNQVIENNGSSFITSGGRHE